VQAHKFAKPAQEKIAKAGGTAEVIGAPATSGAAPAPAAEAAKTEKKPKKK